MTAFLSSKVWTTGEASPRYQVMLPPKNIKSLKNKRIYIPLSSENYNNKYERAWSDIIIMLADIYQIEHLELELLFSKSQEQLNADIKMMQTMLLYFK